MSQAKSICNSATVSRESPALVPAVRARELIGSVLYLSVVWRSTVEVCTGASTNREANSTKGIRPRRSHASAFAGLTALALLLHGTIGAISRLLPILFLFHQRRSGKSSRPLAPGRLFEKKKKKSVLGGRASEGVYHVRASG